MAIQIEINESQIKALTDFYIQRLKTLRDEIIEREREVKEINATIQVLRKSQTENSHHTDVKRDNVDYSDKWPWIKKIQFAIQYSGTPLTTKEIVDVLSEFETSFIYDRKRAVASISSVLSGKSGEGREFGRAESVSGDFAYFINGVDKEPLLIPELPPVQINQFDEELPF